MLLTDTNILLRISQGKAMAHVEVLRRRGITLATTEHNAFELMRMLTGKLGLINAEAEAEADRVLAPFDVILADDYDYRREDADARLREGGKSDWPMLAAALAHDGQIWSADVDFFGVGVPVWTTANLRFVEQEH